VQPVGGGWYRYHALFAEVLRLKLRHEPPGRVPSLHRRAARWHERNGRLTDAMRHAPEAGDWELAAIMVVDALAISEIIERQGGQSLAGQFRRIPPQSSLDRAAAAPGLGRGRVVR
jgi:LuxR family maltose regulon positive regulatory protein